MDILLGETGQVVLSVPGAIPAGNIVLSLYRNHVELCAGATCFARVTDIETDIVATLSGFDDVPLLEVIDPENPPCYIKCRATVQDQRKE
ncbi:MAG: hypothetical protein H6868_07700 [Rhodospirillales bacterium]|nr:hypothetical protein [Rhodospirillales bacterium]